MGSTLTIGVRDGKQRKKIERNTRISRIGEILSCLISIYFMWIAHSLRAAQSPGERELPG